MAARCSLHAAPCTLPRCATGALRPLAAHSRVSLVVVAVVAASQRPSNRPIHRRMLANPKRAGHRPIPARRSPSSCCNQRFSPAFTRRPLSSSSTRPAPACFCICAYAWPWPWPWRCLAPSAVCVSTVSSSRLPCHCRPLFRSLCDASTRLTTVPPHPFLTLPLHPHTRPSPSTSTYSSPR
jgi:hypothetical protein